MKTQKIYRSSKVRCVLVSILLISLMLCAAIPVYANGPEDDYVPDDTDGTEMQIILPAQVEFRMGAEWAGAEFALQTDYGQYPGTVPVSPDGTLRMEIGGSETYVLQLVTPTMVVPSQVTPEPAVEVTPDPSAEGSEPVTEDPSEVEESPSPEPEASEHQGGSGVPTFVLILIGGAILIAGGVFLGMRFFAKRQDEDEYDEDDEDD